MQNSYEDFFKKGLIENLIPLSFLKWVRGMIKLNNLQNGKTF